MPIAALKSETVRKLAKVLDQTDDRGVDSGDVQSSKSTSSLHPKTRIRCKNLGGYERLHVDFSASLFKLLPHSLGNGNQFMTWNDR